MHKQIAIPFNISRCCFAVSVLCVLGRPLDRQLVHQIQQDHEANTDGTELPSHWLNAFNVIETRSDEIEPGRLAEGASHWTRVPAFLAVFTYQSGGRHSIAVLNDHPDTVRVISTTSAAGGPACVEFDRSPSSVMDYLERCAAPRRENGVTSVQFIEYPPQKSLV